MARTIRSLLARRPPTEPEAPAKVVAYTRVSTLDQKENGQSLELQQRQIEGWAQMMGCHVDRVVVEGGVSGGLAFAKRPEGAKLMAELGAGDTLVCSKLDRFSRDLLDCQLVCREFQERRVRLFLLDVNATEPITGNGISKLFMQMLGAFAEFERDRIATRIREAKADQKAQGKWLGGLVPFGHVKVPTGEVRNDKRPIYRLGRDPEQQKALKRILKLRQDGLSSRKIAADLAEHYGIKLSHVSIQKICGRETS